MGIFFPDVAYAAPSTNLNEFITNVNTFIINPLILFLFALALAYFLFGVFEFIANGANDEKKTTGKSHMFWGVVGFTIMIGVWFIMGVVLDTLNIPEKEINPEKGTVT